MRAFQSIGSFHGPHQIKLAPEAGFVASACRLSVARDLTAVLRTRPDHHEGTMKPKSITGRDPHSGEPLKISVESGRIQSIDPGPADERAWLSSGFIDLQVNGYLGSDLNSAVVDPQVVISLTRKMAATGVTTYLPTIVTASEERITAALRTIAEARRASPLVAHTVPFVHVEGPHISPEDGPRGAHAREHVRPASLGEFDRWQAASGNLVGMVTISPHREDALEYISVLADRGIVMAIGHSDATPAQIHAAADAGATLSSRDCCAPKELIAAFWSPIRLRWEECP
jgi:N-acetylglucosamine-6-phosphate deacetylase